MKVKILIILALVIALGGGVYFVSVNHEKEKRKSDFFKNDLKDLDTTDGEKF